VRIDADLMRKISRKFELTGTHIMNVEHYVCLEALSRNNNESVKQDLKTAIQCDFAGEGRTVLPTQRYYPWFHAAQSSAKNRTEVSDESIRQSEQMRRFIHQGMHNAYLQLIGW